MGAGPPRTKHSKGLLILPRLFSRLRRYLHYTTPPSKYSLHFERPTNGNQTRLFLDAPLPDHGNTRWVSQLETTRTPQKGNMENGIMVLFFCVPKKNLLVRHWDTSTRACIDVVCRTCAYFHSIR